VFVLTYTNTSDWYSIVYDLWQTGSHWGLLVSPWTYMLIVVCSRIVKFGKTIEW